MLSCPLIAWKRVYHKIVKNNINQGHPRASILLRTCLALRAVRRGIDGARVFPFPPTHHAPALLSSTMAWLSFPFLFWVFVAMEREEAPLLPPIILVHAPCLPTRRWKKKEGTVPDPHRTIQSRRSRHFGQRPFCGERKNIIHTVCLKAKNKHLPNVAFPAGYVH